jgi:hypothetical protein
VVNARPVTTQVGTRLPIAHRWIPPHQREPSHASVPPMTGRQQGLSPAEFSLQAIRSLLSYLDNGPRSSVDASLRRTATIPRPVRLWALGAADADAGRSTKDRSKNISSSDRPDHRIHRILYGSIVPYACARKERSNA